MSTDKAVLWCDTCEREVDDSESAAGICPRCGTTIVEEARRVPWYFKCMVAATVIYLGYRTYQGVTWLIHHV